MDALQFTYGGDEDGDTSEANSPPPSVHDGETEDSTPTAAADISGTNPDLLEYSQVGEIKNSLHTDAVEGASSGEIPPCGTAVNSTATTVDKLGMNSELPGYNQVDIVKVGFQTTASRDVSVGEKTLYGTLPVNDTDQIVQSATTAGVVMPRENPLYETPQLMDTDQDGGNSSNLTAAIAVDILGKKPEMLENNQVDGIKESLQTAAFGDASSIEISPSETPQATDTDQIVELDTLHTPDLSAESDDDNEEEEALPLKKQKHLSDLPTPNSSEHVIAEMLPPADIVKTPAATKASKKSKKKNKDVWSTTSRKGKKKTKHASCSNHNSKDPTNGDASIEDKVLIAPIPRFPDKNDDSPDMNICLSKVCKAEKVELSDDRMSASSTKGYRMVKATRGVTEGAWYFEIKVVHLGETGHTRLGWATEDADLQAPVGYDGSSYGYRDMCGYKLHKALREEYGDGEGYKEGDVIGFYISLPDGGAYAPSPQKLVWHKGQRYVCASNAKEEPKVVPGSEISYFRNGICQGVAFTDLYGGCYYPAASMYTLPNQPPCVVKFNFGPDFEMLPEDFGERPVPRPMFEVPYQSYDGKVETGTGTPWINPRIPIVRF